mgnify:CR=1 FL=1
MRVLLRSTLNRFPLLKRILKSIVLRSMSAIGMSHDYIQLREKDVQSESKRLRDAWQSQDVPVKQRELVDAALAAYRRGAQVDVFDVMVRALRELPTHLPSMTVLEVGCSSGYYSEVFEIASLGIHYHGCDYSEAFVELAHQKYPALCFDVEDGTALKYGNDAFDIVISGCCLLHIPEYQIAVAQTARVARCYAIFHRTPVVLGQPNRYYRKQGYGVEMVEIHFNEPEFIELLKRHGLELIATYTLHESVKENVGSACRTYVCKKIID